MSTLTRFVCVGVSCDATNCHEGWRGGYESEDYYLRAAVAKGWTVWRKRSTRTYCPQHGPRPEHRMREVTGYYQGGE